MIKTAYRGGDASEDFDLYNNYKAIAWAIAGVKNPRTGEVKYPSADDCSIAFRTKEHKPHIRSKDKKSEDFNIKIEDMVDIFVIDIETEEVREFKTIRDVMEFLGEKNQVISNYIRRGYSYRGKYKITLKANPNFEFKQRGKAEKAIIAENIKTGEKREFKNSREAADYIGLSRPQISQICRNNRITKAGWKLEFMGDK